MHFFKSTIQHLPLQRAKECNEIAPPSFLTHDLQINIIYYILADSPAGSLRISEQLLTLLDKQGLLSTNKDQTDSNF